MRKKYPFKFLDAYTKEDSQFYFGRDEEIALIHEMVFQTDLLLVYGASGTGKTSLIQCGLASKFQSHEWLSLFVRKGKDINRSLLLALDQAGGDYPQDDHNLAWLEQDFGAEDSTVSQPPSTPLARKIRAVYLKHFKPVYLIFDQFEELYILGTKQEQQEFFETVKEILSLAQPVKIIISIREEYLGYLYEFERRVPGLLRKKLRVEPMNYQRVHSVIEGVGSSKHSNISFKSGEEEQISGMIFEKIRGGDKKISIDLPYLQVFMDKLYLNITNDETRTAPALITAESVAKTGDIGDVLRNLLDEQVEKTAVNLQLSPDLVWRVLSPFVTLEGTKEPLSTEMLSNRLPDIPPDTLRQILHIFVNCRILRYSENEQLFEIAHDSLARQIQARRSDEEIALLEVQRLVRSQSLIHESSREFFTERQLDFIEPFLSRYRPDDEEMEWIRKSRDYVDKQKQLRQQKQQQELARTRSRLRRMAAMLAVACIALLVAGWQYFDATRAKDHAEVQQHIAEEKSTETEQALLNLKAEQAAKLSIEFENLQARAVIIREAGGYPRSIIEEMEEIAAMHPDSLQMNALIDSFR